MSRVSGPSPLLHLRLPAMPLLQSLMVSAQSWIPGGRWNRWWGFGNCPSPAHVPLLSPQASLNPSTHKLDEELCQTLTQRYVSIMNRLQSLGYNGRVHPALTEQLVNAYGILRERPELAASEGGSYSIEFLQHVLVETVHPNMLTDALLLLSCLSQLSHDDGKPMFIW